MCCSGWTISNTSLLSFPKGCLTSFKEPKTTLWAWFRSYDTSLSWAVLVTCPCLYWLLCYHYPGISVQVINTLLDYMVSPVQTSCMCHVSDGRILASSLSLFLASCLESLGTVTVRKYLLQYFQVLPSNTSFPGKLYWAGGFFFALFIPSVSCAHVFEFVETALFVWQMLNKLLMLNRIEHWLIDWFLTAKPWCVLLYSNILSHEH